MPMDREIVNTVLDADKCLMDADDLLAKKNLTQCHEKIREARDLLLEIVKEDERDGTDVELERSKSATKSMTLPYSEKF